MILTSNTIKKNLEQIGPKAANLYRLSNLGLNVPRFVVIPPQVILAIHNSAVDTSELIKEIQDTLPVKKYAVRSSTHSEDGENSSQAGQFMTKVDLSLDQVLSAIQELIQDAHKKLSWELNGFSIIVQEYIELDISGVIFTRNPLGGREMMLEYHKGRGEDLVSGKITPQKLSFYHNENSTDNFFTNLENVVDAAKKIEDHFKFPQDIEWGVKNLELIVLQTRPITTLSREQFEHYLFLDNEMSSNKLQYYQKTKLTESVARPTNFMISLLDRIYSEDGPVASCYKKLNITYKPTNFRRIIGNELYVDTIKEMASLLPSFQMKPNLYSFRLKFKSGFVVTLKNLIKFNKLKASTETIKRFSKFIEKEFDGKLPTNFSKSLDLFLKKYSILFKINLFAEKSVKNLYTVLEKEEINPLDALDFPVSKNEKYCRILDKTETQTWQGNSLDIADTSEFVGQIAKNIPNQELNTWFENLPKWKKNYLTPYIINAQEMNDLREYGRWITVKYMNHLRELLNLYAQEHNLKLNQLYFATIDEILTDTVDFPKLKKRQQEYNTFGKFTSPITLTSKYVKKATVSEIQGVSSGKAVGKIVTLDTIEEVPSDEKVILYVPTLTPDLTKYFGQVVGILSQTGGLLSHLAIVARESNVPVIVGVESLDMFGVRVGDRIKMDGENGRIEAVYHHKE